MSNPELAKAEPVLLVDELNEFHRQDAIIDEALAVQIAIKHRILKAVGFKKAGTISINAHGFKVSTVGKVTTKVDPTAWRNIREQVPEAQWPVREKTTLEVDTKMLKAIQAANPGLWDKLSPAFITTPSKPSVKITKLKVAANE